MSYLIENTGLDRPYWFTIYLGEMTYSADKNDAERFAREEDAAMMLGHKFFNTETLRVVPSDSPVPSRIKKPPAKTAGQD